MTYLRPLLPLLLLTVAAGLAWQWRRRNGRAGLGLAALGTLLLFLASWSPVSRLASGTLEGRYQSLGDLPSGADVIVVLAGDVDPPRPERGFPLPRYNTYVRCRHAARLYHGRRLPVVASGGGSLFAAAMRQTLEAEGVPPSMIWTEQRSDSTYENALRTAEMLQAKGLHRVILVTEAYHMYRAERCFRKQGLTVIPAPCGFRSTRRGDDLRDLMPGSTAIAHNDDVLHEWIGLAWYRLRGRI